MKYGELNLGQVEALVNKLGGMDGVRLLLGDELEIKRKELIFKHDKRKDGWKLDEDVPWSELDIGRLEIVSFFVGDESRVSGGFRVPCLDWNGDQWYPNFIWLGNDWNSYDRLIRPRRFLYLSKCHLSKGGIY